MIIHCTKKFFAKLPQKDTASSTVTTAIGLKAQWLHWHANLITVQRRQCVILVHYVTRFLLFIPCLTKKDFADLYRHFEDTFINTLLKSDIEPELINTAAVNLCSLQFGTTFNRAVQGTMNQVSQEIDLSLHYNQSLITDINHYRLSADLSERPYNVKGEKDCIWPIKAIADFLKN